MQGQQIKRRLHVIAVLGHRGFQRGRVVVGIAVAQRIRLVVQHPVAPFVFKHQVGKAHQQAVHQALGQRRAGPAGQQVLPAKTVQCSGWQLVAGEPEFHLGQHLLQAVQRGAHRRQRGAEQFAQPAHHPGGPVAPALALTALRQALRQRGIASQCKTLAGQPFQLVVQEVAGQRATWKAVLRRTGQQAGHCLGRGNQQVLGTGRPQAQAGTDRQRRRRGQIAHQRREAADAPVALEAGTVGRRLQQRLCRLTVLQGGALGRLLDDLQADLAGAAEGILQQARDVRLVHRDLAGQQAAEAAAVEQAGLAGPDLDRRHAHPQGMAGARQGHVEQAQVLLQALFVGGRLGRGPDAEINHPLAIRPGQGHKALTPVLLGPAQAGGKGQVDQRVLQALALVHRDHLDQVGIAFQPQHLLVGTAALGRQLPGQPADQGLLALQLAAGGLQQLGQVQHIGQAPLAVGLRQPAGRQVQQVQGLAQHRQHTLAQPDPVELSQLLDALLEGRVVLPQLRQLGQRQADGGGGQRRAGAAAVQRVGHCLQPAQQIGSLGTGQHRILVRQVDRRHAALAQGKAHRIGFAASAHQHRNVGRPQALEALLRVLEAGLAVVQQRDDVFGAMLGQAPLRGAVGQQRRVVAEREHRQCAGP